MSYLFLLFLSNCEPGEPRRAKLAVEKLENFNLIFSTKLLSSRSAQCQNFALESFFCWYQKEDLLMFFTVQWNLVKTFCLCCIQVPFASQVGFTNGILRSVSDYNWQILLSTSWSYSPITSSPQSLLVVEWTYCNKFMPRFLTQIYNM